METVQQGLGLAELGSDLETFLGGMETVYVNGKALGFTDALKPSLVEWKPGKEDVA